MSNLRYIINMANSIVGVSILSMPYCFKEVGLVLGVVMLLLCSFVTKVTCLYLVRAAIMSRRRSYEFLALSAWGGVGKLAVELAMVLFLVGIGVSFHVVMGDLLPGLVAAQLGVPHTDGLRTLLLVGVAALIVLPLCLLRNIDSLASMSACSIGFYFVLVLVIGVQAIPPLMDGTGLAGIPLCDWSNFFNVLPIMCLALACQSNVFEIYEAVPDASVPNMRAVVGGAMNLCSALYGLVGVLGCIAFHHRPEFAGNILLSLPPSPLTELMKMMFVVSVAISFPLLLFPCRTSIYSLLYRRNTQMSQDMGGNYMPEHRFRWITIAVVALSVTLGIFVPSIEFVLGLLGSTLGCLISLIFPALLFIRVYGKQGTDQLLAKAVLVLGVLVLVTGTYHNLASSTGEAARLSGVLDDVHMDVEVAGEALAHLKNKQGNKSTKMLANNIDKSLKAISDKLAVVEQKMEAIDPKDKKLAPAKKLVDDMDRKELAYRNAKQREFQDNVKVVNLGDDDGKDKSEKAKADDDLARREALLKQMEEQNLKHEKIIEEEQNLLKELKQQKQQVVAQNTLLPVPNPAKPLKNLAPIQDPAVPDPIPVLPSHKLEVAQNKAIDAPKLEIPLQNQAANLHKLEVPAVNLLHNPPVPAPNLFPSIQEEKAPIPEQIQEPHEDVVESIQDPQVLVENQMAPAKDQVAAAVDHIAPDGNQVELTKDEISPPKDLPVHGEDHLAHAKAQEVAEVALVKDPVPPPKDQMPAPKDSVAHAQDHIAPVGFPVIVADKKPGAPVQNSIVAPDQKPLTAKENPLVEPKVAPLLQRNVPHPVVDLSANPAADQLVNAAADQLANPPAPPVEKRKDILPAYPNTHEVNLPVKENVKEEVKAGEVAPIRHDGEMRRKRREVNEVVSTEDNGFEKENMNKAGDQVEENAMDICGDGEGRKKCKEVSSLSKFGGKEVDKDVAIKDAAVNDETPSQAAEELIAKGKQGFGANYDSRHLLSLKIRRGKKRRRNDRDYGMDYGNDEM